MKKLSRSEIIAMQHKLNEMLPYIWVDIPELRGDQGALYPLVRLELCIDNIEEHPDFPVESHKDCTGLFQLSKAAWRSAKNIIRARDKKDYTVNS